MFSYISIHAAREGGDGLSGYFALLCLEFQSTPPVKAATCAASAFMLAVVFQSTPPVKAATSECPQFVFNQMISIHAAREGGDPPSAWCGLLGYISIHAAREGGDVL